MGRFHQAICPLEKELWFEECLRVEHTEIKIALAEGSLRLGGGIILGERVLVGGSGVVPFKLYPGIWPKISGKHGKPRSGRPNGTVN